MKKILTSILLLASLITVSNAEETVKLKGLKVKKEIFENEDFFTFTIHKNKDTNKHDCLNAPTTFSKYNRKSKYDESKPFTSQKEFLEWYFDTSVIENLEVEFFYERKVALVKYSYIGQPDAENDKKVEVFTKNIDMCKAILIQKVNAGELN